MSTNDTTKTLAADEPVNFTWPEGFLQVAHSLTEFEDDAVKEEMLTMLVTFAPNL